MPITQQQWAVINTTQDAIAHDAATHIRVVAGPGSGKSQAIEKRVEHLLASGVTPSTIAVVSFTRASARDLQTRVRKSCEKKGYPQVEQVSISTLHSLCLTALRSAGLLSRFPVDPIVLMDLELKNFYDPEFGQCAGIPSTRRRTDIRRFFEAFWSTGQQSAPTYVLPRNGIAITTDEQQKFQIFHNQSAQVYACVLPGEIVRECVDQINAGALDIVQILNIKYMIVDEYQDLNPADIEFIDILATSGVNVMVAGDDDQSIYSFRHASPLGIQNFVAKYPQCSQHALNTCVRCSTDILAAGVSLVVSSPIPNRIPKTLVSAHSTASPTVNGTVVRAVFRTHRDEATFIAQSCEQLLACGVAANTILILLSNSKLLWSPIQDALLERDIPFEYSGDETFADSIAGIVVQCLLRISTSLKPTGVSDDYVATRMLFGSLSGVGISSCERLRDFILQTPNTNYQSIFYTSQITKTGNSRLDGAISRLRKVLSTILAWSKSDTLDMRRDEIAKVLQDILGTAYISDWMQFCNTLPSHFTLEETKNYTMTDTIEQQSTLVSESYRRIGEDQPIAEKVVPAIRIMSMHGAKGLTANAVFIPGLEDGVLPNDYQKPYPYLMSEAARLLYVSITRARACCVMSYARYRAVFGNLQNQIPSIFLNHTGGGTIDRTNVPLTQIEIAAILRDINNMPQ
ncbi:MAG: ATP-dependent helicase [Fimbriimonadaceae bacterium]|nr:ATP-dependent helicase [Fimbriimonadaceae bacterium]